MAITFDAGTNLITLTGSGSSPSGGTSWANAYDMEDVLTACGGVVTKQGANAYDVSARMVFETGCYFVSKSEFVELKANPTNPAWTFRINSGAHVQFGDYNSTDKYSYNGCRWDMPSLNSGTGSSASGNAIAGEFLVYGSKIITNATAFQKGLMLIAGATVRYYNSLFQYAGYFWASDTDVQDVKWFGAGGSYDILAACALDHNWGGLTTMGCQKGIFFSATTTGNVDVYDFKPLNAGTDVFVSTGINASWLVRVINSPLFVTCSNPGAGKRGVQRCYTFNVKVTNDQGTPIVGATVELKDVDGTLVFSEDTIAGGVLATDEIVVEYWFRNAADGGNKSYNDHTLKVTSGSDETEYKITIDHQISEDVTLLPQSVASYDNIMAALNDIKGTGFAKDTHSLTDIEEYTDILDDVTNGLVAIKAEVEGLGGVAMRGTDGVPTNPLLDNDARIDTIAGDVVGLDGVAMRGTNSVPTNPLLTNDARLNNLDATISSRSSHVDPTSGIKGSPGKTVQEVYDNERGTDSAYTGTPPTVAEIRTEIEGVGTKLTGVKDKTDNLPDDPADQSLVEAAITATEGNIRGGADTLDTLSDQLDAVQLDLDTPEQYKADVSVLALEASVQATQVFVLDALGISSENVVWSAMTHDVNHNLTTATITQYEDNTLAVVRKVWTLTATYDGNSELTSYQMVVA